MADDGMALPHVLTLKERAQLSMTGVSEVVSFDENMVIMHTALGTLTIQGQQLQLKQLSTDGGQIAVNGNISALIYEEPRPTGSWLQRLLR